MSDLLPTAMQAREKFALAEAEKASEALRRREKADAEKKALIDHLSKPSGVSEEEAFKRAAAIINRAIGEGLTEVEVLRFPNGLCNAAAVVQFAIRRRFGCRYFGTDLFCCKKQNLFAIPWRMRCAN